MVEHLTGKNALNPSQLARETGIRHQNLCRWLDEAHSLPLVASDQRMNRRWSVEQKARIVAEATRLTGDQPTASPESEGVKLAEFERRRLALDEDGRDSLTTTRRIRQLVRDLARKEKAPAEAATLLVLKKTIGGRRQDDDDSDEHVSTRCIMRFGLGGEYIDGPTVCHTFSRAIAGHVPPTRIRTHRSAFIDD